jgi:hypothetical protein
MFSQWKTVPFDFKHLKKLKLSFGISDEPSPLEGEGRVRGA